MSDYFLGEIRAFSFDWAPAYWAVCDGRIMQIQQNNALYSLLMTQFGGDGRTTFGLPDLQGRVPVHLGGQSLPQALTKAGSETVILATAEMPAHNHPFIASTETATQIKPAGNMLATVPADASPTPTVRPIYGNAASNAALAASTIGVAGGGQPHNNMQPFLVVNYCIALAGIYPTRD
jgi:microcystin-dependent protein